jgi:hypothetical protein
METASWAEDLRLQSVRRLTGDKVRAYRVDAVT